MAEIRGDGQGSGRAAGQRPFSCSFLRNSGGKEQPAGHRPPSCSFLRNGGEKEQPAGMGTAGRPRQRTGASRRLQSPLGRLAAGERDGIPENVPSLCRLPADRRVPVTRPRHLPGRRPSLRSSSAKPRVPGVSEAATACQGRLRNARAPSSPLAPARTLTRAPARSGPNLHRGASPLRPEPSPGRQPGHARTLTRAPAQPP
jgi:hypothetical protein